jgi:hypothetical protein
VVTARALGVAGNSIAISETETGSETHVSWSGSGHLVSGRDVETVTIDGKTYSWKATLTPTEGEVLIGANVQAALANLLDAINRDTPISKDGVKYKCAAAHPTVAGTSSNATTLVVTAKTKGAAGNSLVESDTESGSEAHVSWGAGMSGGIDGTIGIANEICADGSYLYHCIAANTVADTNWRKISLGSAY